MEPYHVSEGVKDDSRRRRDLVSLREKVKMLVRSNLMADNSVVLETVLKVFDLLNNRQLVSFYRQLRACVVKKQKDRYLVFTHSHHDRKNLEQQIVENKIHQPKD